MWKSSCPNWFFSEIPLCDSWTLLVALRNLCFSNYPHSSPEMTSILDTPIDLMMIDYSSLSSTLHTAPLTLSQASARSHTDSTYLARSSLYALTLHLRSSFSPSSHPTSHTYMCWQVCWRKSIFYSHTTEVSSVLRLTLLHLFLSTMSYLSHVSLICYSPFCYFPFCYSPFCYSHSVLSCYFSYLQSLSELPSLVLYFSQYCSMLSLPDSSCRSTSYLSSVPSDSSCSISATTLPLSVILHLSSIWPAKCYSVSDSHISFPPSLSLHSLFSATGTSEHLPTPALRHSAFWKRASISHRKNCNCRYHVTHATQLLFSSLLFSVILYLNINFILFLTSLFQIIYFSDPNFIIIVYLTLTHSITFF